MEVQEHHGLLNFTSKVYKHKICPISPTILFQGTNRNIFQEQGNIGPNFREQWNMGKIIFWNIFKYFKGTWEHETLFLGTGEQDPPGYPQQ